MPERIAIIGAGASGLAAAIEAKRTSPDASVTVFERQPRAGRKLLATGNGACNLTNSDLSLSHFHGGDSRFALFSLEKYGLESTLAFFEGLGVVCREINGRYFPRSMQAGAVQGALRLSAQRLGVFIKCENEISGIGVGREGFTLHNYAADRFSSVIVAAGGAASPKLGGCDYGYKMLKNLGHTIVPPRPTITQLRTDSKHVRALDGIRAPVRATLLRNGESVREEHDEVLFTDYGLSGPAILQLSCAYAHLSDNKNVQIVLDLTPEMDKDELVNHLFARKKLLKGAECGDYLVGLIHSRIGVTVLKAAGIEKLNMDVSSLSADEIKSIANVMKDWRFDISGDNGFAGAQATAGGCATAEFDDRTMMSKIVPGIFACGETLDIDGDCGGYNLQWAWSSGRLAGLSAVKYAESKLDGSNI